MTARSPGEREAPGNNGNIRAALSAVDVKVGNPARIWDYWLGGKDNFAADREAARKVMEVLPWMPAAVRGCREYLSQSVRRLVTDHGIRQFLDIGTGLPTAGNVHEVAQAAAPSSRIVYVDYDPVVSTHARALLTSHPEGKTDYVQADLRDPATVLAEAARILDFSQPVAVLLVNVLHFVPDADDPYGAVGALVDALPPGSFLVMVHGADDLNADTVGKGILLYNQLSSAPLAMRSREQVTRFFDGLELLDTGRGPGRVSDAGEGQPSYYAIGRKP
jgi:S-adenosyl methyltransferase